MSSPLPIAGGVRLWYICWAVRNTWAIRSTSRRIRRLIRTSTGNILHRKHTAPEEQKRFENTQEAIIDPETWHTAQRVRKTVRRPDHSGVPNRLTGLLYCADCGGKMYNERAETVKGKQKNNYLCSSYRKQTADCTMHFIRSAVVEELILQALREVGGFARDNEVEFVRLVMEKSTIQQEKTANVIYNAGYDIKKIDLKAQTAAFSRA